MAPGNAIASQQEVPQPGSQKMAPIYRNYYFKKSLDNISTYNVALNCAKLYFGFMFFWIGVGATITMPRIMYDCATDDKVDKNNPLSKYIGPAIYTACAGCFVAAPFVAQGGARLFKSGMVGLRDELLETF